MNFKYDDYEYFVLLPERMENAHYGFRDYTDIKTGELQAIYDGKKDRHGDPIPRQFNFSKKERTMRIPKLQKANGKSIVEFLKNHPECEGSPNNEGQPFWFRMVREEADAEIANEQKALRRKAENMAADLKGDELFDVAVLYGVFDKRPAIALHAVSEAAHNDPQTFLDIVESPDMAAKALVHKALSHNLFAKKGKMIVWENETIGADFDEAVSRLLKEEKLAKAVQSNINKFGEN